MGFALDWDEPGVGRTVTAALDWERGDSTTGTAILPGPSPTRSATSRKPLRQVLEVALG